MQRLGQVVVGHENISIDLIYNFVVQFFYLKSFRISKVWFNFANSKVIIIIF
jgi:hypothetical protein